MTNNEILQADILDILFEHRNKSYGAYALRRTYNRRLGIALGGCLGLSLLFFLNGIGKGGAERNLFNINGGVVLSEVHPTVEPEIPEKKIQQKDVRQVKSVDNIRIDPDETDMPEQDDIKTADVSDIDKDGNLPGNGSEETSANNGQENKTTVTEVVDKPEPVYSSTSASFPGGREAFADFLRKYLQSPDELEPGEKKSVIVRFMVDVDGSISKTEIVESAGSMYDKEVIRVLRKMPKWMPAMQNGNKVTTYFTQTVTFVGIE